MTCGDTQGANACNDGEGSVKVNGARNIGVIAADVVHEAGGHGTAPPGMSPGRDEIRAYEMALRFYERLDRSEQTDPHNHAVRALRKKGIFEQTVCKALPVEEVIHG